jgi:4-alpha-glucanotransferase
MNTLAFTENFGLSVPISALRAENDFGIGDISSAYKFIDFLHKSKCTVWKMLPINATSTSGFNSPYSAESAFALDFLYIDIMNLEDINSELFEEGRKKSDNKRVEFESVRKLKFKIIQKAFKNFYLNVYNKDTQRTDSFNEFIDKEKFWLDNYAIYKVIQEEFGYIYQNLWPKELKDYDTEYIEMYSHKNKYDILLYKYIQWIIHIQFVNLKKYANKNGVSLIGDFPAFLDSNSSDIWGNRNYFNVDENLKPYVYVGHPPDQFNSKGQIWKLAIPDWNSQKKDDYYWYKSRINKLINYFDGLRLDYFMFYTEYYVIDLDKKATEGRWVKGPGESFISKVLNSISDNNAFKFFAEIPVIDPDKHFIDKKIIDNLNKVLKKMGCEVYTIFAFDYKFLLNLSDKNLISLETTTHDMPPLKSYWHKLPEYKKKYILNKLNISINNIDILNNDLAWKIFNEIVLLNAHNVIFPIQDILGTEEQINIPGTTNSTNWGFRLSENIEDLLLNKELIKKMINLSSISNRGFFYKDFSVKTLPLIDKGVERRINLGEKFIIWVFSDKKDEINILTDISVKGSNNSRMKKFSLKHGQYINKGYLYKKIIIPSNRGEFKLSLEKKSIETQNDWIKIIVV